MLGGKRNNPMLLYEITIFLSAFLLLQVKPIIAKLVLPWFGGTAAVWTTCLLFFQLLLLAGYAHVHLLETRLAPRTQAISQMVLIAGCVTLMGVLAIVWKSPILP